MEVATSISDTGCRDKYYSFVRFQHHRLKHTTQHYCVPQKVEVFSRILTPSTSLTADCMFQFFFFLYLHILGKSGCRFEQNWIGGFK